MSRSGFRLAACTLMGLFALGSLSANALAGKKKSKAKPKAGPRDVFAYVIHEGKVRAPAAAMALIENLKE